MVRSPEITDSVQPKIAKRHHKDSPKLWVGVATGSIAFHLLLLFSIVPLTAHLLPQQKEAILVPIELIDANPAGSSQSAPVDTSVAPAPPQTLNVAPQASTIDPQPNPVPEFAPAPETSPIVPNPRFQTLPTPAPESPSVPSDFDETTDPVPSSEIPPDTQIVNPSNPTPPATLPSPSSNVSDLDGAVSPLPSEGDASLPEVAVNRESEVALRNLVTNVRSEPLPEQERRDIPEQIAQPKRNSQSMSDSGTLACQEEIVPEVFRYWGREVVLRVTVDETGKVIDTQPREVGDIPLTYYELAECLLRDWEFEPARMGGTRVRGESLVYVTINRE